MYVVLQLYTDLKELKSSEYYHRSKMQEYLSIAGNWVQASKNPLARSHLRVHSQVGRVEF